MDSLETTDYTNKTLLHFSIRIEEHLEGIEIFFLGAYGKVIYIFLLPRTRLHEP